MEKQTVELAELQQVVLKMAAYFVEFCQEHDLTCYFCGGGCIGAIRHEGFIPWDDDLDFFMPRPDYDKLQELWEKDADTKRYPLLRASKTYNDHNSFTTIRDTQTTFIKTYQTELDIPHGISLDIFPLDGAPAKNWQRKMQKVWALIYALFCSQVIPQKKHGGLKVLGSKLLLGIFRGKRIRYAIWHFAEKQMAKYPFAEAEYVTELCVGPKYMGNLYPREWFKKAIYRPFEGIMMPLPFGYDEYLRQVFGDYMELPPVAEQKPHHEAVFIDPKITYETYRNIHYLSDTEKELKE